MLKCLTFNVMRMVLQPLASLVWFGLVCLFIRSVTHVTFDTAITDYNLYITTQYIIYVHPPDII